MNKTAKFVDDARKEIMFANMEGTLSNEAAVAQLAGVKTVCAVITSDSMSKPLKEEIAGIVEKIDGTVAKLSAE